jgi:hypothetical protein
MKRRVRRRRSCVTHPVGFLSEHGTRVLPAHNISDRASIRPVRCGAVAQLGERLNGIQEVDGSTPFSSTPPSPHGVP